MDRRVHGRTSLPRSNSEIQGIYQVVQSGLSTFHLYKTFKVKWDSSRLRNYVMSTGKQSQRLQMEFASPVFRDLKPIVLGLLNPEWVRLQVLHLLKLPEVGDNSFKIAQRDTCISLYKQSCILKQSCGRTVMKVPVRTYLSVLSMNTYPDNETFHSPSRVQYFTKVMPVILQLEQGFPDSNRTRFIARRTLGSEMRHHVLLQINTKLRDDTSHNYVICVAINDKNINYMQQQRFINNSNQLNMFRALVPLIFRSTRLCVTAYGIMHPLQCPAGAWKRISSASRLPAGSIVGALYHKL